MTREEILKNIETTIREIFDDETLQISEDTKSDDVEGWDSLEHINIVGAIEKQFKIKFDISEIIKLTNIGAFVNVIDKKIN